MCNGTSRPTHHQNARSCWRSGDHRVVGNPPQTSSLQFQSPSRVAEGLAAVQSRRGQVFPRHAAREAPATLWGTGGLLTMIIIVFITFSLGAAWMGRYGDRPATAYPRLMAGSLLPIVLGYVVAHYATLLIVEGQRVAINFSDPLGRRWNVFGSAEMGVNSAIFNHPTAIAAVQTCASSEDTYSASSAHTRKPSHCYPQIAPSAANCHSCW
jgi:hypothetical protein